VRAVAAGDQGATELVGDVRSVARGGVASCVGFAASRSEVVASFRRLGLDGLLVTGPPVADVVATVALAFTSVPPSCSTVCPTILDALAVGPPIAAPTCLTVWPAVVTATEVVSVAAVTA
jgi:hypothetical protein